MPTKLVMPLLGEAVTDATVTRWLKNPGDQVEEFEPILEVNTDKVDTEIPSPTNGVILAALAKEGEVVKVGATLGWIGQPGEAIPGEGTHEQPASTTPSAAPAAASPAQPAIQRELGFISPVVAKIAAEQNVDLSQVPGTGIGGRITKKDIENYLQARQPAPSVSTPPPTPAPTVATPYITTTPAAKPVVTPVSVPAPTIPYTVVAQTPMRKAIAEHMLMSKTIAPHVSTIMEVDMSCVADHRNANKEAFASEGANLTYTAYFVAASVAALKAYPLVNSSWSEDGVRMYTPINIGMAVSLGEDGLIVPVIKNADNLSLLGIARVVNDLANRARARKLQPDEVKGGTFTITNHGVTGSLFATPIINQPQCAILGVGMIQTRPVVIADPNLGDVIAIRTMLYLSLTFDHRIIDGAIADTFLARLVDTLQNWS
ncbi:MAG TPA: dihydrolipoamide acetyltransferase family protein [Anaerolineales bacterium]|nr:dihydrolipoamide acetyltransferase family protein [Anaerolineales bacterium]